MPKHAKAKASLKLGWLVHLPRKTPALEIMLADIGSPSAAALAKALGVHPRTAERWRSEGTAPRPVMLALYYATSWGRSDVNCQAVNDARLYLGYVGSLRAELEKAHAQLARIGQIGEFGSANDPAREVVAGRPHQQRSPKAIRSRCRSRAQMPRRSAL